MGTYVYRATAKMVKLTNGEYAHLAKYAYKPGWGYDWDARNAKMHFKSGCTASERMQKKGNYTGLVVNEEEPGAPVYRSRSPVFYDDKIFSDEYVVEGVTVAPTGKKKIYKVFWYEDEEAAFKLRYRDTQISATSRAAAEDQFRNTLWVQKQYPEVVVSHVE